MKRSQSETIKALVRSASFGRRRGWVGRSLSDRVICHGPKGGALRVAQRLQRARSSGGVLSGGDAAAGHAGGKNRLDIPIDPFVREVGVKVHPIH